MEGREISNDTEVAIFRHYSAWYVQDGSGARYTNIEPRNDSEALGLIHAFGW